MLRRKQGSLPEEISGRPWLRYQAWKDWGEPYRMSYTECVHPEHAQDAAVHAVRDVVGRVDEFEKLDVFVAASVREHPLAMGLLGDGS